MESIILMVLLAVGSSLFKAFISKNKAGEYEDQSVSDAKPRVKTTVRMPGKLDTTQSRDTFTKAAPMTQKAKMQPQNVKAEPVKPIEKVRAEVLKKDLVTDKKRESESVESAAFMQELTLNDLQRSIVMAEILGKPKAFKRN